MESDGLRIGLHPHRSLRLERQDQIALRFHHLSMSNSPPTDAELSEIQTTILPGLGQDIFAVDSAIAVAPPLESLQQERDALEKLKRSYDYIISMQRRIPPEIWSEIFLHGDFLDQKNAFDWPSRTIWQISQVCQTWRHLALSLHSCWSSIVLDFSYSWPAPEKDAALLSFVLERSHQHLLDITLIKHSIEDLPLPLRRLREKVFAESHRWRTARLVDYHQVRSDLLYAPLRGRLPQLEHLEFESDIRGMDSDGSVILAFEDCPRLVTVHLNGADPRIIKLPVEQITCLRLGDQVHPGFIRAFVDLARQCPLLEILRMDLLHPNTQDSLLQPLTLPSLRDLSGTSPDLLGSLTLPRLEVATLNQRYNFPHPDTLYAFQCLIQRSRCAGTLTELRIMQVPLNGHHSEPHLLVCVLSQINGLATLQLEASVYDFRLDSIDEWSRRQVVDLMNALEFVAEQRFTFLPRLVSLEIDVTGHTDMDYLPYFEPHDDFVGMLSARRTGNEGELSKLERFHFRVWADFVTPLENGSATVETIFDEHETSVLRGLVDDGMSLDIRFDGLLASGL